MLVVSYDREPVYNTLIHSIKPKQPSREIRRQTHSLNVHLVVIKRDIQTDRLINVHLVVIKTDTQTDSLNECPLGGRFFLRSTSG